jgi:hypothetical protein
MTQLNPPKLSQHIQDHFVKLIADDSEFLRLSRSVIKQSYFQSFVTSFIVEICYRYFDNFKRAPGEHLNHELDHALKDLSREKQSLVREYLEKISAIGSPNKEYIVSQLSEFAKSVEFEQAAEQFSELVESGNYDAARSLMLNALRAGIPVHEVGIIYGQSSIPTYHLKEHEYLMGTGIPALDQLIRGYKRKQLICFLGSAKGSKTWTLTNLARRAIIEGLNVLHISHEVSAEETEMRYDMMFGSLTSTEKPVSVEYRLYNKYGEELLEERHTSTRDTVYSLKAIKKLRKKTKRLPGKLIIKKYPMGSCSFEEIERYINYLEIYESFSPDVLINDYVDIMKLPLKDSSSTRDRLNEAYKLHKQIADERNILVATVSQVTRAAIQKANPSMKDIAEDIRKAANVDVLLALAQTEEEQEEKLMRVLVLANRSGPQNCGVGINMNLVVGQLALSSWVLTNKDNTDMNDE